MSIKVSSLVWDKWPNGGSEMLCMLALADWCNDEGGSLYPSIRTLSKKMRVSESQARRVLHKLIKDGFVNVVGNENGGSPGTTRQYHLNVPKITSLNDYSNEAKETGSTGARGRMDAQDGSHGCVETGSTHDTQNVIEPLEEPLVNQGADEEEKPKRKTAYPKAFEPNQTCRQKASDLGVHLDSELEKFKDFHQSKGNKYLDWQAAFRNWLTKAAEFRAKRGGNVHPFPQRPAPSSDDCGGKVYIPTPANGGGA